MFTKKFNDLLVERRKTLAVEKC